MLDLQNLKWCAIQPLTGGMYLGAENAIGHPAEFILSYPGFGDPIIDKKSGEIVSGKNEYHLMKYLDKVGRRPEYKVLNRAPFQNDFDMNPEIIDSELWSINKGASLNYDNIDLVVAVPVCSGLSTATIGTDDAKRARNCNMLYISNYALRAIKPKIYIFENAPTFMGERADYIREELEQLAEETGYSIVYYKTDTKLHDNCQTRKRTFITFLKKDYTPKFDFEKLEVSTREYLSRIPEQYRTQGSELDIEFVNCVNYFIIDYLRYKFGNNWRSQVNNNIFKYVIDNNLWDEILDYTNNVAISKYPNRKNYMNHFVQHFLYKTSMGKGVYHSLPHILTDDGKCPAVMFKMVQSCLALDEDRLLNMRELLHLMGMPHDFEIYGDANRGYCLIGQNVPVRTAQWIVSEAIRAYDRDNDLDDPKKVRYFDNMKQKEIEYKA